jgi:hypothetical protein
MKDMIKTLKNAWAENPLELLKAATFFTTILAIFIATLWVGDALGLK